MACKVAVPSQLESLTKEQLIKVVQDLVEERSQRSDEASRKHKVVDDAGSQTPKKQRAVQVAHRGDESAEKQAKAEKAAANETAAAPAAAGHHNWSLRNWSLQNWSLQN